MKPVIEFKKQRELGDILSDTFKFLRQEFKPFTIAIFTITGPFMVLYLLAMVFYMYMIGDLFTFNNAAKINSLGLLLLTIIIFIVCLILVYVFANAAALHYIKSYIKNNGKVDLAEVRAESNGNFWRFVGLGIAKWMTLIISGLLCFFPILYFLVPMALVYSIMVFENKDVSDSYSYSYSLIKGEFWSALGTIIVIGIIVVVAGYAFQMPAVIYSFIKMGTMLNEVDITDSYSMVDPIDITLSVIGSLFQFFLNFIAIVAYAFIYFNLNEKKHFTGTFEKIQSLGNSQ
jgi:hypothetical protein